MARPAELIGLCSKNASQIYLWTHYYDSKKMPARAARHFAGETKLSYEGFEYVGHKHVYGGSFLLSKFYGGTQGYSHWMKREELFACLNYFGFKKIEIQFEDETGHGPSISLLASK